MASCNVIDFRCILLNEIFGSVALALLAAFIVYLLIAGKLRLGPETTIAFAVPFAIIGSLTLGNFQVIFAFATLLAGILMAIAFNRIVGNR